MINTAPKIEKINVEKNWPKIGGKLRTRRIVGSWPLITIRKCVNNVSVILATDIVYIECMTDNNNYWN